MMLRLTKSVLALFIITLLSCHEKRVDKFTDTFTTGVIPIAVDANFEPIVKEEIDVFLSRLPNAGIKPMFTNEVNAIDLLLRDSVRLAVTTRPLSKSETDLLLKRTFVARSIHVATDAIALIVNRQNPDTLMSITKLKLILTGKVKQWSDVYPSSKLGNFKVIFDNPNSSTVRYAIDSICNGEKISSEFNAQRSYSDVIKYVSSNPSAIGVIGVNWLNNSKDSTNLSFNNSIRVMSVSSMDNPSPSDSYKPYQAYLFYGYYPLTRSVYVILKDPRGSLPTSFATFVASDRGQRIILKAGLVPATQPVRVVNVSNN